MQNAHMKTSTTANAALVAAATAPGPGAWFSALLLAILITTVPTHCRIMTVVGTIMSNSGTPQGCQLWW